VWRERKRKKKWGEKGWGGERKGCKKESEKRGRGGRKEWVRKGRGREGKKV
jgi:hypothetical protein